MGEERRPENAAEQGFVAFLAPKCWVAFPGTLKRIVPWHGDKRALEKLGWQNTSNPAPQG